MFLLSSTTQLRSQEIILSSVVLVASNLHCQGMYFFQFTSPELNQAYGQNCLMYTKTEVRT